MILAVCAAVVRALSWKSESYTVQRQLACKVYNTNSKMGNLTCCEESKPPKEGEVGPANKRRVRFNDHLISCRKSHTDENARSPLLLSPTPKTDTPHPPAQLRGPWNYQSRKYLGRGVFGCVVLAEEKESGRLYAMKIIEKAKIREFNVMQSELLSQMGRQEFLVATRETFQNQTHIYLVMEYLPKGDLYYYLRKKEVHFPEPTIRAIIAEIVVGIAILHNFGVVYRELKPENLLVTEEGHIKLTDYGFSKVIIENKTSVNTFVGSLEYMPPQALEGEGDFGQKGDLWALGVLMFELHFRESPFGENEWREGMAAEDYRLALQTNVLNERINAKIGYMSSAFRDLLLRLLEKDPQKRISLEQTREHEFFKEISWSEVEARTNSPPLKSVIEKHDSTFRDVTNEEYSRRRIAKHRPRDNYEIRLFEFRNSE